MTSMTEGADHLWYARAVLADIATQDDTVVIEACRTVEAQGTDHAERAEAAQLRRTVEGNTETGAYPESGVTT